MHSIADLALVAVGRGSIDEAVARSECRPDCIARLIRGRLEHAETECGHLDAVVEGDGFHGTSAKSSGGFVSGSSRPTRIPAAVPIYMRAATSRHAYHQNTIRLLTSIGCR